MEKRTLEDVCQEYKLSEEEHILIGERINKEMLLGKKPVVNPVAIIDIAPPGSGKTGLNGMALREIPNRNAVIINSDELKPWHPRIDEIAKLYPEYYTKVTNLDSNPWTDDLFEKVVNGHYNVIFEGTGRNFKLLQKMIVQMADYKIIVRGMAVNELNCLMSIVERYEEQVKCKGWGRLVTVEHFYKAYEEMLDNIAQIEGLNIVDEVEVYRRGKTPVDAIKIYNGKGKEYNNAREAVIIGRKKDEKYAVAMFESKFKNQFSKHNSFPETKTILEKIYGLYSEHKRENEEVEL